MTLLIRVIRIPAGWLAIPASLFMVAGCVTTEPVEQVAEPVNASHQMLAEHEAGSPFGQVFEGEADVVVLTFYDLYCVACQQSADNFSAAHAAIEDAFPDSNIQMTGVGLGDTAFELKVFQRRYALPYTSLPDPEKSFEEPFSIRGTPTILAFRRDGGDCIEIYRHEGRFRSGDVEKLLESISNSVSSQ